MTKWTMTGALAGRIIDDWFDVATATPLRFIRPQEWLDVLGKHDVHVGGYAAYRIEDVFRCCPEQKEYRQDCVKSKMLESFMHDYFSMRSDVKSFRNAAHVLLGEGEDSPTWSWWPTQDEVSNEE
jgi:hypothetical protein